MSLPFTKHFPIEAGLEADRLERQAQFKEIEGSMYELMLRLYPICRSLAGPGNRKTLDILGEETPLQRIEIPSGTEVFDWTVPDEWTPRDAWLLDPTGERRAIFSEHNLNLVSHSEPIDTDMDLEELLPHIYSLLDQPDVIPYVTRYYDKGWGFCMTNREKDSLPKGCYKVHIDSDLHPGSMSLGEVVLPGKSNKEILISTYICHPSMANDNLSGVVVAAGLYKLLAQQKDRRLTYRFVFVPETIGSLAWLDYQRHDVRDRLVAGIVLSCIGYDEPFIWKRSRQCNSIVDRIAQYCIGGDGTCIDFDPVTGSDERQYCSPGFNLSVGMLSRSYPGTFSAYHTSADTPDQISKSDLLSSLKLVYKICKSLELNDQRYKRVNPEGEPMLSKRELYNSISIRNIRDYDRSNEFRTYLMWVLNYCDGLHDLIDIAEMSQLDLSALAETAEIAVKAGLLKHTSA